MFTREEEILLEKAKSYFSDSYVWAYWEETKLAALLDIYGGHFPEIFKRDEKLVKAYSIKLVDYCESNHRLFPATRENNEILASFRKKREEEYTQREKGRSEEDKSHSRHKNSRRNYSYSRESDDSDNEGRHVHDNSENQSHALIALLLQNIQHSSLAAQQQKYDITNKDVIFLIEGGDDTTKSSPFYEVSKAQLLARANGCAIFDSISSFDVTHLSQALQNADEKEQKLIILRILTGFLGEGDPNKIIEKLIVGPFQSLVEKGVIISIPAWVKNINIYTMDNFAKEVLHDYFNDDIELLKPEMKLVSEKLKVLSNQISCRQLISYLRENKDVTCIYGLIGQSHLPMLNNQGIILKQEEDYYHVKLDIDDRIINVHLFGGMHGEIEHYNKMEKFVVESGLKLVQEQTCQLNSNSSMNSEAQSSYFRRSQNTTFFTTATTVDETTPLSQNDNNTEKDTNMSCCTIL